MQLYLHSIFCSNLSFIFQFISASSQTKKMQGIYLYGSVGCGKDFIKFKKEHLSHFIIIYLKNTGKTMLMDLFYNNCEIAKDFKRRTHFHSFMLDIHSSKFF